MAERAEHLVGRAAEVGALDRAILTVERGSPGVLAVVGEPGIGKTRLLRELGRRADARRWLVLAGGATELEADLPFWVFVDALDEHVAGLDPRRWAALPGDVRDDLALVLPGLPGAPRAAAGDDRYRVHRAVRELLELLAGTAPVLLVLDDLHWADPASVELLGALLRRPPDAPVLLAPALRPRQAGERLTGALERAHRTEALTRLELGPLARDEAGELLGSAVDGARADALYEESGGNPFYLEQLARAGGPPSSLRTPAADGLGVPPAVAAALAEELARLPATARRVLAGAAVAGDPFPPELAAAAAGVGEDAASEALDGLLAADLVRRTDVPRRFRFRHPLVRRAVHDGAPGAWLLGAHERCADALAARGASAAARAHHVEFAARQGDVAAVELLRAAGEGALRTAPASAARWLGAALRLLPDAAPPEPRVALLAARAGACSAVGRLDESRADLLAALALAPGPALAAACAGVEGLLGRHDEAHARLLAALADLPDPDGPDAVALGMQLAIDGLFRADWAAMREWAARARDAAPRALIAAATALLALGDALAGEVRDGTVHREEAAALVDAMPDAGLALDAAAHLAAAELYLERFDAAAAHAERALEVGRATGQRFPTLVPTLGTAWFMRGRLAEAATLFDEGVEAARVSGVPQAVAWSLINRSLAATTAGDTDTALATAGEAAELTAGLHERFISAAGGLALAAPLLARGDPEGAEAALLRAAGGEALEQLPCSWRVRGLELLTLARLARDRHDEARAAAAAAEAAADAFGLPLAAAYARRALAAVALAADTPAPALDHALVAVAAALRAGAVVEAALARALAGRALARAGETDRAATELAAAATAFDACGAQRHRDAAEHELRRLGRHVHRRTRLGSPDGAGVATLTARELQVARLVVDRRTNAEIAGELFLSLKTVESHMRNLFRKLDVASRVEVARAVERADRAARSP